MILDVLLHGMPIGTLTHIGNERTVFAFNDDYIDAPDRPALGLGFKDRFGGLITEFRSYNKAVMPFFSNLLPEGHLRDYLAAKAGMHREREFHLLRVLGEDLPGAITVLPANRGEWPLGQDDQRHRTHRLRFSLAGVQLKLSAAMKANSGLTIPASGIGGGWIVKFASSAYEAVPENEFSMMTLAKMVGINVPPIDLIDVSAIDNLPEDIGQIGERAFIIQRFDRTTEGKAVHIEDFAQVFGVYPDKKYEAASIGSIARVLAAEGGMADIEELVRRIVFNALIGNGDMHLKNWSLIYLDRRTASIAPAYDFVSTIPYIPNDDMALKVSRTKRFTQLNEDELSRLAIKATVPEQLVLDTARQTVELFHEAWRSESANLPMTAAIREAIVRHIATVPLAQGGI